MDVLASVTLSARQCCLLLHGGKGKLPTSCASLLGQSCRACKLSRIDQLQMDVTRACKGGRLPPGQLLVLQPDFTRWASPVSD